MSSSDNRSRRSEVQLRCTPTWIIIKGKGCLGVPGLSIEDTFVPFFTSTGDSNTVEQICKGMKAELTKGALEYANMYIPQSEDCWEDCVRRAATKAEEKLDSASYYFRIQVQTLKTSIQSASGQFQPLASFESNSKTKEETTTGSLPIQFLVSRWTHPKILIKPNLSVEYLVKTDGNIVQVTELIHTTRQLCRIDPAQREFHFSHALWLSAFDSTSDPDIKQSLWVWRTTVSAKLALDACGLTDVYNWEIKELDETLITLPTDFFGPDRTDYGLNQDSNC